MILPDIKNYKHQYLKTNVFDFHLGELGSMYAFMAIGSISNRQDLFEMGEDLLCHIIDNQNNLEKDQLIFLGNCMCSLNKNDIVDLDKEFYDIIDQIIVKSFPTIAITYLDYKIFPYLIYTANRINNKEINLTVKSQLLKSLLNISIDLIMKVDNLTKIKQISFSHLKFLYFCNSWGFILDRENVFVDISKRLQKSIALSIKNLSINISSEKSLEYMLLLNHLQRKEMINFKNNPKSDFEKLSLSKSIQLLFLLSQTSDYFDICYQHTFRNLNPSNYGLLNSFLGLSLLKNIPSLPHPEDLVFLIQLFDNNKYDLSFGTIS